MSAPEVAATQHEDAPAAPPLATSHGAVQHDGAPPERAIEVGTLVDRAFSRRTAIVLAIAATLSLLATLILPILGGDAPERETRAPNAYSRSAVGHHAFVAVLRELGLTVLVSRHRSASRVGPGQALVIAEPADYDAEELQAMVAEAMGNGATVVVVLPKWDPETWDPPREEVKAEAEPAPARPAGLGGAPPPAERVPTLLPASEVVRVLDAVERGLARYAGIPGPEVTFTDADVVREPLAQPWDGPLAARGAPAIGQLQTVAEVDVFDRVLGTGETLLVADRWRSDGEPSALYVVADPELFNTMGLGRGDNAVLAHRLFTETLGVRSLVFDEVVHGFKKAPSLWSDLFTFPLIVVTFHLVGLLALALWAAGARFGKPEALPPRVTPGKGALITNTASLLALGGHSGHALREYLRGSIRALARDYALPARLDDEERLETLARLAAERGVGEDLHELARRAAAVGDHKRDARRALALARRIYRFRREMTDGHPHPR